MATTRTSTQVIRLTFDGGNVIVTPEDEDRFVLTAQSAVRACQDHRRQEEAIRSFKNDFLRPISDWCQSRSDRVRACYIPVPVGHVQVFMVGTSPRYDFTLGRELAALELSLAEKGWRLNVLQIPDSPEEDLQTYFDIGGALEVYAELRAAPGQGKP
jgi:hypothetical protein